MPNMELNPQLITRFNKVSLHVFGHVTQQPNKLLTSALLSQLLRASVWTDENRRLMRGRYLVSRTLHLRLEAPRLRGYSLRMSIKNLDFQSVSADLLRYHQRAREATKLGIKFQ